MCSLFHLVYTSGLYNVQCNLAKAEVVYDQNSWRKKSMYPAVVLVSNQRKATILQSLTKIRIWRKKDETETTRNNAYSVRKHFR